MIRSCDLHRRNLNFASVVVADIIPKGRWAAGALGRKSDNGTSSKKQ